MSKSGAIGGIAAAVLGGLGTNPYLLMLGKFLQPGTDWKTVLVEDGLDVAKEKLQAAWEKRVTPAELSAMVKTMEGEGWSWEAAGKPEFLAAQKVQISEADRIAYGPMVNGFIISRDMVFSIFRETGVPGGGVRDGWRDTVDNATWEAIAASVSPTTSLEDIAILTFRELRRVIL